MDKEIGSNDGENRLDWGRIPSRNRLRCTTTITSERSEEESYNQLQSKTAFASMMSKGGLGAILTKTRLADLT
ncbi:hypothetical protein MJO28_012308 [Puccinia striiformis f. sp. tritici]|uniref:Uncharacterized protein n=1 Tax=Puccinia striiformis f. sp. tritici TaxID=168172 RepID=A0ACC0E0S4_9BASI|nr:hypothetical protein MJO28_012308 [Puccinia striiformis f. sp. tritici]